MRSIAGAETSFEDTYYGDLAKVRLAELKQVEAAKEAATKEADDDARARAEGERQRLALLQQEDEKKRASALAAAEAAKEAAKEKTMALALAPSAASLRRHGQGDLGAVLARGGPVSRHVE